MQRQRSLRLKTRPALRWVVVVAALAAATTAPDVRAETDAAPATVPSLTGELLLGTPTTGDDFADTSPSGCDVAGSSTFGYTAAGTADGPYPGTFTEQGTVTVLPQTGPGGSFGLPTGSVATLTADFTIQSGGTTIDGTRWLTLAVVTDPRATCAGFVDRVIDRLAALGPLSGFDKEVVAGAGYEATITTPDGAFVDRGHANSSMSVLQYRRADCGCTGHSSSYAMRLTSAGVSPVPPDDATPPVVVGTADRPPNQHGWYREPVTITWTATDESGSATTPGPTVADVEGEAVQYTSEPSADGAGNTAIGSYTVSLDRMPPTVSIGGLDRTSFLLGEPLPAPTCSATDALSGVDGGCHGVVSGTGTVGAFTYRGEATDRAGNVGVATAGYRVAYRFDGFEAPVNDTAHDEGDHSVFKAGGTVPLKIRLRAADGTIVQPATPPRWLAPVQGGPTSEPVNEVSVGTPTEGDEFRLDGDQWIFNWQTSRDQAGSYWRVGVVLDDGTAHTVVVGLR